MLNPNIKNKYPPRMKGGRLIFAEFLAQLWFTRFELAWYAMR